jgi:hypothetical protein
LRVAGCESRAAERHFPRQTSIGDECRALVTMPLPDG